MKINVDIKLKRIVSAYVDAHFDDGKKALERADYKIISAQETAQLRIYKGINSQISKNENWTSERVVYVPGRGVILTKLSGLTSILTATQVEEALSNCVNFAGETIPTRKLEEDERTNYLFGKTAGQYGEFLQEAGISEMTIWLGEILNKPFARPLLLYKVDKVRGSPLVGIDWDLGCGGRVRGIKYNKISKNYKPTGLEEVVFGDLII